ncbi:MAG: hypothetical protein IKS51_03250 [Erysipelotrichaceae bacterium]|nr:hypothetical protein [Erysipelotrichaceae bacterium]
MSKDRNITDIRPDLIKEWNYEKNIGIVPTDFSLGSHRKVWWKCSKCGYEWEAVIKDRKTRNCPVCAGKAVWPGHNDLASTNPDLLKEWDYEKNTTQPTEVSKGSGKKIWWKCSICGGSWEETINNRTNGYGCPYCSGRRVLVGYNDLQTKYPDIAKEWDYDKNAFLPTEVTSKSMKRVWWVCPVCNNHYCSTVAARTSARSCPKCAKENQTSFPEQAIYYYIKRICPDSINGYRPKWLNGKELDVFIPSLNVAIEYDGSYWHQNIKKDLKKDQVLAEKGITFYRIREHDCPELLSSSIIINTGIPQQDGSHVEDAIQKLYGFLGFSDRENEIKISEDRFEILSLYVSEKKEDSLSARYPMIAAEWNYERNGNMAPQYVLYGSHMKVWWKCSKCGGEWEATVKDRTNGSGCPVCANKVVVHGINDLATIKPEIAKEWNYERNGSLTPDEVGYYEDRVVWWKCSRCGREFKSKIQLRKRVHCSTCNYQSVAKNRHLVTGKNDLATLRPDLLKEWDFDKNKGIDPSLETCGSHDKVWWRCSKCGHEWQAMIVDRNANHGCPMCAKTKQGSWKKIPVKGSSFADLYPELVVEWNYDRNGNKKPEDYKPFSSEKVWWKCSNCGREWQTSISNRASGHGCRSCVHKKH